MDRAQEIAKRLGRSHNDWCEVEFYGVGVCRCGAADARSKLAQDIRDEVQRERERCADMVEDTIRMLVEADPGESDSYEMRAWALHLVRTDLRGIRLKVHGAESPEGER